MIIVGLGNPENNYKNTLHNAGYMFVDYLEKNNVVTQTMVGGVALTLKPTRGMNHSGEEVKKELIYRRMPARELIIAHDDIDIPSGKFKIIFGGGDGGHKGIRSIIENLKTDKFWRVKIGVRPKDYNPSLEKAENWVLKNFTKEEKNKVSNTFSNIIKLLVPLMMNSKKV